MMDRQGKPIKFTESDQEQLVHSVIEPMASDGLRTICVAYKQFTFAHPPPAPNDVHIEREPEWDDEEHIVSGLTCLCPSPPPPSPLPLFLPLPSPPSSTVRLTLAPLAHLVPPPLGSWIRLSIGSSLPFSDYRTPITEHLLPFPSISWRKILATLLEFYVAHKIEFEINEQRMKII